MMKILKMRRNKIIATLTFMLVLPFYGLSQNSDLGNWLIYIGSKELKNGWNIHNEVQYRNYDAVGDLEQLETSLYQSIIENIDSDSSALEEEEDRVDIYKMLSCIEYAIIKISPYYILRDGTQIEYSNPDNIKFQHLENVMNGYLAFYGALEFVKRWAGKYSKVFSTETSIAALNRVEEIAHRSNAMTLLSEHVHVVVYSAKSSVIPLFSNACWWRLVCAFGAKNDTE